MTRLSRPAPALQTAAPVLPYAPRNDELGRRTPLRHLYKTQQWRRLRWRVLKEALFTCARCSRVEADTSLLVCDHIEPHRGNEALFWKRSNLQCLCAPCHNSAKQSEEAATR